MENKPDTEIETEAENDPFSINAKSSVEIKQTTRGPTWKIKIVTGEEKILPKLEEVALQSYINIKKKTDDLNKQEVKK